MKWFIFYTNACRIRVAGIICLFGTGTYEEKDELIPFSICFLFKLTRKWRNRKILRPLDEKPVSWSHSRCRLPNSNFFLSFSYRFLLLVVWSNREDCAFFQFFRHLVQEPSFDRRTNADYQEPIAQPVNLDDKDFFFFSRKGTLLHRFFRFFLDAKSHRFKLQQLFAPKKAREATTNDLQKSKHLTMSAEYAKKPGNLRLQGKKEDRTTRTKEIIYVRK